MSEISCTNTEGREKIRKILVFYVNIGGANEKKARTIVEEVQQKIAPALSRLPDSCMVFWLPSKETRLEVLDVS